MPVRLLVFECACCLKERKLSFYDLIAILLYFIALLVNIRVEVIQTLLLTPTFTCYLHGNFIETEYRVDIRSFFKLYGNCRSPYSYLEAIASNLLRGQTLPMDQNLTCCWTTLCK